MPEERIQTEFRCTIHSCLGSQQDLYQELQHKFGIGSKENYLCGFKNFLPLSLLFRTPFYLFPDPTDKTAAAAAATTANSTPAAQTDASNSNSEQTPNDSANPAAPAPKRNMAILKTELWIFPPLDWTKSKPPPKSPIYIDLLDDTDDDAGDNAANTDKTPNGNGSTTTSNGDVAKENNVANGKKKAADAAKIIQVIPNNDAVDLNAMPTLERDDNSKAEENAAKNTNAEKEDAGTCRKEENSNSKEREERAASVVNGTANDHQDADGEDVKMKDKETETETEAEKESGEEIEAEPERETEVESEHENESEKQGEEEQGNEEETESKIDDTHNETTN